MESKAKHNPLARATPEQVYKTVEQAIRSRRAMHLTFDFHALSPDQELQLTTVALETHQTVRFEVSYLNARYEIIVNESEEALYTRKDYLSGVFSGILIGAGILSLAVLFSADTKPSQSIPRSS